MKNYILQGALVLTALALMAGLIGSSIALAQNPYPRLGHESNKVTSLRSDGLMPLAIYPISGWLPRGVWREHTSFWAHAGDSVLISVSFTPAAARVGAGFRNMRANWTVMSYATGGHVGLGFTVPECAPFAPRVSHCNHSPANCMRYSGIVDRP